MSGNNGSIDPIKNDANHQKTSMMDLWRQSMARTQQKLETAVGVARDETSERTDLEQKIRNGQVECPTCAVRTYADESSDGGVSFQAPKHIAAASAGSTVLSHEGEHVSSEASRAQEQGGEVVSSTVALEYSRCPDCGRTYVSGGVTKTTVSKPASTSHQTNSQPKFGILDTSV